MDWNKIKRLLVFYATLFVEDERAMTFDIMRILFMLISILLGTFVGGMLSGIIGIGGALIGSIIVGVVIYYIYSMLTGQSTKMMGAVIFGILNYVSTIVTGFIGSATGLTGGIISLVVQALVLSVLWGWIGGKAQSGIKTGLAP